MTLLLLIFALSANSEEPNGRHNGTPAHRYDLRKSEPEPSKRKTESKGTEFIIGETSFEELVRDVVEELYSGGAWEDRSKIRFAREAIKALQTSSEDYLVTLLRDCQVVATKGELLAPSLFFDQFSSETISLPKVAKVEN